MLKKTTTIAAAGGITSALIGATLLAGPAQAQGARSISELIPEFAVPQAAADLLPEELDASELGVTDDSTLRLLGSSENGTYWIGRSGAEKVCLIVHIPGGNEIAASSCGPLTSFASHSLALMAGEDSTQPQDGEEAYLLPADVKVPGDNARSAAGSGSTLLTKDGSAPFATFEVPRADGSTFVFTPLGRS